MAVPLAVDSLLLGPQTVTDGATVTANLDTQGYAFATIRVAYAAEETTHATDSTLSLLQSDDTVVTNFATVTADLSVDCVSAHTVAYNVDLRGKKRYLRLSHTSGTTSGGNITLSAIGSLAKKGAGPIGTAFADTGVEVG